MTQSTYRAHNLKARTLITSNDIRVDISGNEHEKVAEFILTALRVAEPETEEMYEENQIHSCNQGARCFERNF